MDYAGAWSAERDGCHRFVYDDNGKPTECPEPPVRVGWRYAANTRSWHAERGRCHRFIYDEHGKPTVCPEPPVRVGWRYAAHTRSWYAVDACAQHASQLERRPQPSGTGRR